MGVPKITNGRAIAAIRSLRGITQGQLAATLGRSKSWVAAVETGRIQCSERTLEEVAKALYTETDAIRLTPVTPVAS